MEPEGSLLCLQEPPVPRAYLTFRIQLVFYGEVSSPCPTPNLEDHTLSAVSNYLFNIFPDYPPSPPISGGRLLHPQPEDAPCRAFTCVFTGKISNRSNSRFSKGKIPKFSTWNDYVTNRFNIFKVQMSTLFVPSSDGSYC
jgi:hypothetical protein